MILSNNIIRNRLGDSIVISPFDEKNVNTSSYDVTLGSWYFIEQRPGLLRRMFSRPVYNMWDRREVLRVWGQVKQARPAHELFWIQRRGILPEDMVILIPPGRTILAHTNEFIGGRGSTTAWMQARSSYGRNMITVCNCAGYGDVGYINRWTMELTNHSNFYHLPLVVGRRIAQIVFADTTEVAGDDYSKTGKYQHHHDLEKLQNEWSAYQMLPRLDIDRENPDLCPHGFADWDDCSDCCR